MRDLVVQIPGRDIPRDAVGISAEERDLALRVFGMLKVVCGKARIVIGDWMKD